MTNCPDCGHNNLEGTDVCERCQTPLCSLPDPRPTSAMEQSVMTDRIEELAPREPLVVAPATSVGEVLERMVNRSVGCVIVVQEHQVVGIFTERDALVQLNTETARLRGRPISEFMTQSVETLELDDRVAFALHKMDLGGYRHLPILAEGRIAGVISVRDILDHITKAL